MAVTSMLWIVFFAAFVVFTDSTSVSHKIRVGNSLSLCCNPPKRLSKMVNRKRFTIQNVKWFRLTNQKPVQLNGASRYIRGPSQNCKGQYSLALKLNNVTIFDEGKYRCVFLVTRRGRPGRIRKINSRQIFVVKVLDGVNSAAWRAFPKFPKRKGVIQDISSGMHSLWATNRDGIAFVYNKMDLKWKRVKKSNFSIASISAGESGVWAIAKDGKAYVRVNVSDDKPAGSAWIGANEFSRDIGKSLVKLKSVATGPPGVVIALGQEGELFCRTGVADTNPTGDIWYKAKGNVSQVSCGSYGCFGVDASGRLYFASWDKLKYCSLDYSLFKNPLKNEKTISAVAAGIGPTILATDKDGNTFRRKNVALYSRSGKKKPYGTGWERLTSKKMRKLTVGYSGIYGLDLTGKLLISKLSPMVKVLTDEKGTIKRSTRESSSADIELADATMMWILRIPSARMFTVNYQKFDKKLHCITRYEGTSLLRLRKRSPKISCSGWGSPPKKDYVYSGCYIIEDASAETDLTWEASYGVISRFTIPEEPTFLKVPKWPEMDAWTLVDNPFVATSVGSSRSGMYATDDTNQLYYRDNTGENWIKIREEIKQVTVDESGVWALTTDNKVGFRKKIGKSYSWIDIPVPPGANLKFLEAGLYRVLFALDSNQTMWCLSSYYNETIDSYSYKWFPGKKRAQHLSAGAYGVWASDAEGNTWTGEYSYRLWRFSSSLRSCQPSFWRKQAVTGVKQFAVETGSEVWALTTEGDIYRSMDLSDRSEIPWKRIFYSYSDKIKSITGGNFQVLGITERGKIVQNAGPSCGGYIDKESTGVIFNPHFPKPYPSFRRCLFIFHFPGAKLLKMSTNSVDLKYGYHCDDRVTIKGRQQWEGTSRASRDVCGSGGASFMTYQSDMFLAEFTSYYTEIPSYRGFLISYNITGINEATAKEKMKKVNLAG